MSADLLRRAAAKLREHAEKAWPGAWFSDEDTVYTVDGVRWVADCSAAANAANHIALMHPPVALALADVLLHAAQRFEQAHGECLADGWDHAGHPSCPNRPKDIDRAIALAREILREQS